MRGSMRKGGVRAGDLGRTRPGRLAAGGALAIGILVGGAALPAVATGSRPAARHGSPSNYYRGKTVTILVPNAPGGNIDVTARVAVPYLQKALGAAGVKLVDVTGAGGVTGLDQLWTDPRDGLTVGYTNVPVALLTSLVGGQGISYNAGEFQYLGRLTASPRVVVVSTKSGITSPSQLRGKKVLVPLSGFDDTFYTVVALAHSIGFTPEYVSGFASQAAVLASLGSGATELTEGSLTSLLPAIQAHLVRPIMFETNGKAAKAFSSLPAWSSLSGTTNSGLVNAFSSLVSIEGSYFVAPHTPKAAVTQLRNAIGKMFRNPAFKSAEVKAGATLYFLDGSDEQTQVGGIVKDVTPYLPLLRAALKAAGG